MAVRDHYALLNVSRNATLREIEDAYRRLRVAGDDSPAAKELDLAYETLRSPNLKRKYDSSQSEGRATLGVDRKLADKLYAEASLPAVARAAAAQKKPAGPPLSPAAKMAILCALGAAFVLVLTVSVWPRYAYLFRNFEKGSHLESMVTGEFFGEILEAEPKHVFPGGRSSPAYLVRLSGGGEQWIPKGDLNRLARLRPKH